MGFKATEAVDELTYDFNPHVNQSGTIPEPTTAQVEDFRARIFNTVKDSGIDPEELASGKVGLDSMDTLLETASGIEAELLGAVADLTGIAQSTLNALPYRVRAAFFGWVMGEFFSPEA